MAYWPNSVLGQCEQIRGWIRKGKTLEEIKSLLIMTRWTTKGKTAQWRFPAEKMQALISREEGTRRLAALLAEKVSKFFRAMGVQRPGIRHQIQAAIEDNENLVDRALKVVRSGGNLVFVLGKNLVDFVPESMVSEYVARHGAGADGLCLVSVGREILAAFPATVFKLPHKKQVQTTESDDSVLLKEQRP